MGEPELAAVARALAAPERELVAERVPVAEQRLAVVEAVRELVAAAALGPRATSTRQNLTTCDPGQVWDGKRHRCLQKHSGVLPDSELNEYAYALAK